MENDSLGIKCMNAIDTNVWVYAFDEAEPIKQQIARSLIQRLNDEHATISLWQVVSEFVNCLRRWEAKHAMTLDEVDQAAGWMIETFPVLAPQHTTVLTALDLRRRYCL